MQRPEAPRLQAKRLAPRFATERDFAILVWGPSVPPLWPVTESCVCLELNMLCLSTSDCEINEAKRQKTSDKACLFALGTTETVNNSQTHCEKTLVDS